MGGGVLRRKQLIGPPNGEEGSLLRGTPTPTSEWEAYSQGAEFRGGTSGVRECNPRQQGLPLPPAARRSPLRVPRTSLVDRSQESGSVSTLILGKNKPPSLPGLQAWAGANIAFQQKPQKVRYPPNWEIIYPFLVHISTEVETGYRKAPRVGHSLGQTGHLPPCQVWG